MEINFIDLKTIVKQQSTCEDLLICFDKHLKGCINSSKRWDILCSLFRQRRYLKLTNKELVKFFNKFSPKLYCVYRLYLKGSCVYVGSSYDIVNRIINHFKDKQFDFVDVCVKETKEEMLCLEHTLIDNLKPKYNKSSNLKWMGKYSGCLADEEFKDIEDLIVNLPIRKNSGNKIYSLFKGQGFKYPHGELNTNGKHKITAYFVNESNEPYEWYEKPDVKITPQYTDIFDTDWRLEDKLVELGYGSYLEYNKPNQNQITFDNKYIFTPLNWRNVGNPKWYKIKDLSSLLSIIQEYMEGKYGSYELEESKIFTFGKYRNKAVSKVVEEDPKYIDWCITNLSNDVVRGLGLLSIDESITFESAFERINTK